MTGPQLDIRILHVRGCPNVALARERVDQVVERLDLPAAVREVVVDAGADPLAAGFHGSPTILIDGADPFAGSADSGDLRCRLYLTDRGVEGAPSVDQLVRALRR